MTPEDGKNIEETDERKAIFTRLIELTTDEIVKEMNLTSDWMTSEICEVVLRNRELEVYRAITFGKTFGSSLESLKKLNTFTEEEAILVFEQFRKKWPTLAR